MGKRESRKNRVSVQSVEQSSSGASGDEPASARTCGTDDVGIVGRPGRAHALVLCWPPTPHRSHRRKCACVKRPTSRSASPASRPQAASPERRTADMVLHQRSRADGFGQRSRPQRVRQPELQVAIGNVEASGTSHRASAHGNRFQAPASSGRWVGIVLSAENASICR